MAPPLPATAVRPIALRALGLVLAVLVSGAQPGVVPLAQALRAGDAAAARQDYPAAADALAEAADRWPYSGSLLFRAGLAELVAGRFSAARGHIEAAAALDGWNSDRRLALGDAWWGEDDQAAAVAQWELALAERPADPDLLDRLARGYEALGAHAQAIQALSALAQQRSDAQALYRLALLTASTQPAEALPRLRLAADLDAVIAPIAEALMAAIEAGQASGSPAYLYGRVGFELVRLAEWALAEVALGQATALDPDYADAFAYLGLAQDALGKDGQAAYAAAVALAPESALVQYLYGLHFRRLAQSQEALPYLHAAQRLDPQNPAIAAELGGAYASLGELAQAEIWLAQAVSLNEQDGQFWLLLARFYIDHEYHVPELGLPAARMAVSLNPDSALAADALGHALALTGDPANARKLLERALALDPALASAHYHLGLLQEQQGQTAEAESSLNQALSLDPQGTYGGLALEALSRLTP
jgi:tetratricopeptide (TPR) repeat protein